MLNTLASMMMSNETRVEITGVHNDASGAPVYDVVVQPPSAVEHFTVNLQAGSHVDVRCDETNNPPTSIQEGILRADVTITPPTLSRGMLQEAIADMRQRNARVHSINDAPDALERYISESIYLLGSNAAEQLDEETPVPTRHNLTLNRIVEHITTRVAEQFPIMFAPLGERITREFNITVWQDVRHHADAPIHIEIKNYPRNGVLIQRRISISMIRIMEMNTPEEIDMLLYEILNRMREELRQSLVELGLRALNGESLILANETARV